MCFQHVPLISSVWLSGVKASYPQFSCQTANLISLYLFSPFICWKLAYFVCIKVLIYTCIMSCPCGVLISTYFSNGFPQGYQQGFQHCSGVLCPLWRLCLFSWCFLRCFRSVAWLYPVFGVALCVFLCCDMPSFALQQVAFCIAICGFSCAERCAFGLLINGVYFVDKFCKGLRLTLLWCVEILLKSAVMLILFSVFFWCAYLLRSFFSRSVRLFHSDVFLCSINSEAAVLARVSIMPRQALSRVLPISVERYAAMPIGRCMAA